MDMEAIREALGREPFQRFTIRLADGRRLPVAHPEFVAVGKRRVIVIDADDSWSVIEPLLIVSLDYNSRGASKKRRNRGKT